MRHTREEVIKRTIQEFERLDHLVNNLTDGYCLEVFAISLCQNPHCDFCPVIVVENPMWQN